MARRATAIRQSNFDDLLIVDAGNFIGGAGDMNRIKAKYLSMALAILDYSAINLGVNDINLGPDFLISLQREYHLPFVSANIKFRQNGKHFVNPFIIKKINKLSIGILGLVSRNNKLDQEGSERALIIADPIESAREIIAGLKGKCDLIIALSNLGFNNNRNLAKIVPEIDVIISGSGYSVASDPLQIGKTLIVHGKNKGQELNLLVLTRDIEQKNFLSWYGRAIKLDDSFENAPDVLQIVSEFKNTFREYLK